MAEKKKKAEPTIKPFQPVTTNTEYYRGITPTQRLFTGRDASEDQRHAYNLTESQFGPIRTGLNQQLSQLGKDRQYETGVQDNFGEKYGERLDTIGGELQELLRGITGRTQDIYGQAATRAGGAHADAAGRIQGAGNDVMSDLQAEMERLGLGAAGADPMAELTKQKEDAFGRHALSGQGELGNLLGLGTDMTQISMDREGQAAQQWAEHQQNLAREVMANINMINKEYNDNRNAVMSEMQAIEEARGQALDANLRGVIDERLERERQDRLDALSAEMARRGMDVQEGYLGLAGDRLGLDTELGRGNLDVARGHLGVAEGHLGVSRDQLELQRKQLQAELDSADDPLVRLGHQLELQKLEAEIRALDARSAGGGEGGSTQYKGLQGARNWANENLSPSAATNAQNKFAEIITRAADTEFRTGASFNSTLRQLANKEGGAMGKALKEMAEIYIGNHADYQG